MRNFLITIDSSCDCNLDELKSKNIPVIFFNYSNDKNVLKDTMNDSDCLSFYNQMRNGVVFKTSQINPEQYFSFFEELLINNLPIIHISLGSGVSNTINSAALAVSLLKEQYNNVDIRLIDTKLASLGSVLIMNKLIEFSNNGDTVDDAINKIAPLVDSLNAIYTTDTLTYFARGGRLSKAEAFIGNVLKINPILDCDPNGKLRVVEKVRGKNKALENLIKRIKHNVIDPKNQTIYLCHADNKESTLLLAQRLVNEIGFKDYKIYLMGPIIGAHAGPGVIACFFFGKKRTNSVFCNND